MQLYSAASYSAPAVTAHYPSINIPRRLSRGEMSLSAAPILLADTRILAAETGRIAVGGHRGMGQNRLVQGDVFPQYRENTVKSFLKAAENGAAFVELDVQVTKDGVPVIWHDDEVLYGTPENPQRSHIKDLTLAQLQELQPHLLRVFDSHAPVNMGIQPASWRVADDDTLPTLESIFKTLPEYVGIDIEIKMTTPDDIPATPREEIDRVLNSVLPVVNYYSTNSIRTTFFSSFDPDVCSEVRKRQPAYPVMFLSTAGSWPHADPRRTSLAAAIEVAQDLHLEGIVVDTDMLRQAPDAVEKASSRGLVVMTYGSANDEPDWVEEQARLGVRAAIVDDVPKVVSATLSRTAPEPPVFVERRVEQVLTLA